MSAMTSAPSDMLSSLTRTLKSKIAAEKRLLTRLVASISGHNGIGNHYYDQLLRPHIEFLTSELPERVSAITEVMEEEWEAVGALQRLPCSLGALQRLPCSLSALQCNSRPPAAA